MSEAIILILMGFSLLGAMFFSGTETGLLTLDPSDLKKRSSKGSKQAAWILKMLDKKDLLLGTMLVGNNLAVVTMSALATTLFVLHFGNWGPELSTIIVTPIILILGEILPKAFYLSRGTKIISFTSWIIQLFVILFLPLTQIVILLPRLFIQSKNSKNSQSVTREELKLLIRTGTGKQSAVQEEILLIDRLLSFNQMRVRSSMVPLVDVICLKADAPVRDAIKLIREYGISRLPVYEGSPENIKGILFAIDLFKCDNLFDEVIKFSREPYFAPEQKRSTELFPEIWNRHEMAVVVDEYGVATGIVTAEDIAEEIMGDIKDEYDAMEEPRVVELTGGFFVVDASISVGEFNNYTHNLIPLGTYDTLAGFIVTYLQRIPERGEKFSYRENKGYQMETTILEATSQRIQKVLIRFTPKE